MAYRADCASTVVICSPASLFLASTIALAFEKSASKEKIKKLDAIKEKEERKAKEAAEDQASEGTRDLKERNFSSKDMLIGIAASGRTPYVLNAMEYAKSNPAIEQISINFHTPYPGTEYLMLPPEKKAELIDKVLAYKKKGYPIMNSRSGLKLMKRNALGKIELGKECFVTNFIYTDGSRSLCLGYGTEQCRVCGFCMAGEMASVFHFKPDTILSGFKLRM